MNRKKRAHWKNKSGSGGLFNNAYGVKRTLSLEKAAHAMVYAVLAVGRRAPTCNETMETVVWKKLLF
jgi:hypothetical protein